MGLAPIWLNQITIYYEVPMKMMKSVLGLLLCLSATNAFGMNRVVAAKGAMRMFSASTRWPKLKLNSIGDLYDIEKTLHEVGNQMKNTDILELFENGVYDESVSMTLNRIERRIDEAELKLMRARGILRDVAEDNKTEKELAAEASRFGYKSAKKD